MKDFLEKLLLTLKKSVDSDISCLIKHDKKSFISVASADNEKMELIIEETLNSINSEDTAEIQDLIVSLLKFESSICNSFSIGENTYYLLSASEIGNKFMDNEEFKHAEYSKVFETTLNYQQEKGDRISGNSNEFLLYAEASNEIIFKLDEQGTFNYINRYGLKILRYNNEEILGKHLYEFISDDYKMNVGENFQKLLTDQTEIIFTAELITKVGTNLLFEIKLIPLFKEGTLAELIAIGKNKSEELVEKNKNAELMSQLKEANRINAIERDRAKQQISILNELNNLKNEFISNVSHELRTPLASILGFSEAIEEDKNLDMERIREFNQIISTESKRLAKLINDVLDFSELESERQKLQKTTINIIELLRELLNKFKPECEDKKIVLTEKIPESEIIIYADPDRMQKALNYIMANSLKFTNENGRITLMAQEFLKEVEIIISDTGIGIPENKIPVLFDKFSKIGRSGKNNMPGAGFGLVTVKQIIDLHKGLIRVKSEVDKGTSFIIKLPKYSFN